MDVFDELRSEGLSPEVFRRFLEELRALLATGKAGSPAIVASVSGGRLVSLKGARGRAIRGVVLTDEVP